MANARPYTDTSERTLAGPPIQQYDAAARILFQRVFNADVAFFATDREINEFSRTVIPGEFKPWGGEVAVGSLVPVIRDAGEMLRVPVREVQL